jgi:hypothetical protein
LFSVPSSSFLISFSFPTAFLSLFSMSSYTVGLATGYRLDGRGSVPGRGTDFSILHSAHTGSGSHPASYPMGTGALFLGIKRPGTEADHSPPSSAEVKKAGAIPPLPHTCLWHGT